MDIIYSLLSYSIIEKSFYIEDFIYSFKVPFQETVEKLKYLIKEGFLVQEDKVKITNAGIYSLLGSLSKTQRRWWLVVEIPYNLQQPFIEITYRVYIAPFTVLLYEEIEKNAVAAFVVAGNIGDIWMKRYLSQKPYYRLKNIERNITNLEKMLNEGATNIQYMNNIIKNIYKNLNTLSNELHFKKIFKYKYIKDMSKMFEQIEEIKEIHSHMISILKNNLQ